MSRWYNNLPLHDYETLNNNSTMSTHTILITAPGGHIGTELVPALLETGRAKLILPTSNPERLKSALPTDSNESNTTVVKGSIKDPVWIESLLREHGVDTVFLCLTGPDEALTTFNFFDAMHKAGTVRHLINVSAGADFVSAEGTKRLFSACSSEHVLVKSTMELKLLHGNFGWKTTVLGPMLFFSNDERSKGSLVAEGWFDEPLGEAGVSRVSTRDIAEVAKTVILAPEHKHAGTKIWIGSRKTYSGSEVSALWGQALGKDVRMVNSDQLGLQQFEDGMVAKGVPRDWGRDIRLMYELFGREGFAMPEEEYGRLCEVLGREPEDYEKWVLTTGKAWAAETNGESG